MLNPWCVLNTSLILLSPEFTIPFQIPDSSKLSKWIFQFLHHTFFIFIVHVWLKFGLNWMPKIKLKIRYGHTYTDSVHFLQPQNKTNTSVNEKKKKNKRKKILIKCLNAEIKEYLRDERRNQTENLNKTNIRMDSWTVNGE